MKQAEMDNSWVTAPPPLDSILGPIAPAALKEARLVKETQVRPHPLKTSSKNPEYSQCPQPHPWLDILAYNFERRLPLYQRPG